MKASALIIASCLMGALITAGFMVRAPNASPAGASSPMARDSRPAIVEQVRTADVALHRAPRAPATQKPPLINIPKLRVRVRIGRTLDAGPIFWPVTGRPGDGDTVAIAGHRTTHTHPFLDLDKLESGDDIYVRWEGIAHRYVVSGRRIVSSKNVHIADARGHEVLLLTACTPKGSARQRIVIYAQPA